MNVREHMTRDPLVIDPHTGIDYARAFMIRAGIRHLPVLDSDRLVGIVSYSDVGGPAPAAAVSLSALRAEPSPGPGYRAVSTVMSSPVRVVDPDEPLAEAARRLARESIGALPVVESGRLVGILTPRDCLSALLEARDPDRSRAATPAD